MKFFIFMCCTAHLLTGISSRLRRTTPMSPALRSDDAEERQVANFAEMIDFVNSVPNNNVRRRFFGRYGPSKLAPELIDDNPNVTLNNNATGTSHDNATVHVRRRTQDNVQELNTNKNTYRPSFPDDEDDEILITGRNKLANNEKQNSKPKTKEEDYDASSAMYNTDKLEKKTQNNKPSSKEEKTQINEKKADKHNSIKNVTKKENNKKYKSTKFIYSQEKLNEDSIRPKDELDEKINKGDGTNENRGKDKNQKDRSRDKKESNLTSVESLILKRDNNLHSNRDRIEQYSIYLHKGRSENSNNKSKKSHEKIDKNDNRMKIKFRDIRNERGSQWIKVDTQKDYKETLKDSSNEDKWSKKETDWDKNHDEWSNKEIDWEKNDDRFNKKQKDWDNDDTRNKNEKYWDNDDIWTTKEKYWNNKKRDKDKGFDTLEYEWNKRHPEYDKHENDAQSDHNDHERNEKNFEEIDNYYKKRDSEFYKRDNDWIKRDSGENENRDRTYDRIESGNKKSYESVGQDRDVRHDRYKVVDRVDSGSSRADDNAHFF